eukprot:GHVR01078837.1.p1 GENE.GHVR01078837.1~~GHVR01078837.1.p1  ORF type:complete len:232 (+),score=46.58 GHVR01078837.1:197-892(+)
MVKKDSKEGKTDDEEFKEAITLEKAWSANQELKEEIILMKTTVEDVKEVCSKLLELTCTHKEREEEALKKEHKYAERLKEETLRREQEYEERLKEETQTKEYVYAERLTKMDIVEREKFLARERENEILIKRKEKGFEEQKDKYKTALRKLREKEMLKDLPIDVSSESSSSEEDLGLDSDGEFPDFSGMSKHDIETYAYRMAAKKACKRKKSNKKVILKKILIEKMIKTLT